MPGQLSLITAIQTELSLLQVQLNNVNQAVTAQGGALISTAATQTALNTIVGTINTAAALQTNNVINGNQ